MFSINIYDYYVSIKNLDVMKTVSWILDRKLPYEFQTLREVLREGMGFAYEIPVFE
jgi:hypothetical protein